MLGNESFSRAILQERWAGHFCHVVSQHDIVPRLFFSPSTPLASSSYSFQLISHLSEENKTQLFRIVLASLGVLSKGECKSSFWPSSSYLFCTNRGAVCVDNRMLVIKLLYLTLLNGLPSSSLEDHLGYADFIQKHGSCLYVEELMILLLLDKQELNSEDAKEALKKSWIEWYKASCDNFGDQMGYYDSFKQRGASKSDFKVNMNRIKLAQFWDSVLCD
ncbi:hypothetical protein RND71_034384 [Anisodus tanguticus]|uniref:EDS1 EP domain-containing protein n=1 Tax=Anisodus tanguticus TaxID=243964 RepID=A0AAE1RAH1_9SOLA|nr:hypothetical protein RND71_034384 [Anisodus tanguticus]